MPGLKAFNPKLFIRCYDWRLLEQTVVSLLTPGIHGNTRLRRARNGVIVNWFTLLQPTCSCVSNDTWFVILRCLVSKPFNTKLSIRWWDWRLLEQTVVFWHTVKLVWRRQEWRLLYFVWLYCNLHVILLQMIYDLFCVDCWSRIL